jgi:hypothetical protein
VLLYRHHLTPSTVSRSVPVPSVFIRFAPVPSSVNRSTPVPITVSRCRIKAGVALPNAE